MKTLLVRPVLISSSDIDAKLTLYHDGNFNHCELSTNLDKLQYHTNQRLILISLDPDENIGDIYGDRFKDGETVYYSVVGEECIFIKTKYNICRGNFHSENCYKVIATQDQLLPDLIQRLVYEYNNGGMQDFEIEMEVITEPTQDGNWDKYTQYKPKLTNGFVTFAVTVCDKTDTIGKPLEDYINEKHSQDRCMGFINGYEARKSEESSNYNDEEVWKLLQDMHLEFVDSKSKISLKQWFDKNKKK